MEEIIFIVEDDPEGGYNAKALGVSIFTQGETLEELKTNILDAMSCHFGKNAPHLIRLHYTRDEVLEYI